MGKQFNTERGRDRIKALTREQVTALFRAAEDRPVRDRLILAMIYKLAMRTQEVCDLPGDAVDTRRWEITVTGAKHGLTRTYTVPRDLRPLVRAWEKERDRAAATYFTGRQGPLARVRVWQIFRESADAIGLARQSDKGKARGFGVHSLRHAACMHALDEGVTGDDLRDLLRHRDLGSTSVYANLSTKRRNGYLERLERGLVKVGR